ncbi:uncharacterized protein [Eurosta solidaginis]|uniref:uncharacterized protein n=1 Tax=Eurosta solidaginis TaxID=178769 RepID=UPI00353098F1
MYIFLLVLCALVLSHPTHGQLINAHAEVKVESRTLFDDDLREFIEFARLQMPCGYAPAGIPALVPLHASYREVSSVTEKANIHGNVTDLTINGLNKFDVRKLHFNNIFRKVTFDLNFPEVRINGAYKADIKRKIRDTTLHIYGDGDLNLILRNLHINGSFVLKPKLSGKTKLAKFKVTTQLGDVESRLTGLMNSRLKTKLVNKWIEEFIALTFNESPEDINAAMQHLVVPPANKALEKVPVIGVLALVFGLVEGKLPQRKMC